MLLSIIIPIYNTPIEKLKRCFESIKYSEEIEYEIIVVDDGSQNGVGNYIEEYQIHEQRIRYVYQKNSGVSVARNKGLQLAKGAYVMFVDSDDTVVPYSLKLDDFAQDADIVFFDMIVVDKKRKYVWKSFDTGSLVLDRKNVLKRIIISSRINSPCGKFFNSRFLKMNELFFNGEMIQGEDAEFALRTILASQRMLYIERNIYCYWHTFVSKQNRLSSNPQRFIESLHKLYCMKENAILKEYVFTSEEKEDILRQVNERYIDGMFNNWATLYTDKALNKAISDQIMDEVNAINPLKKETPKKIRIKYFLLVHRRWNLIKMIANIRKIYLDIFAKLK